MNKRNTGRTTRLALELAQQALRFPGLRISIKDHPLFDGTKYHQPKEEQNRALAYKVRRILKEAGAPAVYSLEGGIHFVHVPPREVLGRKVTEVIVDDKV